MHSLKCDQVSSSSKHTKSKFSLLFLYLFQIFSVTLNVESLNLIIHSTIFQYLAETLGPLSKEKEQLLSDYNDMKIRRNQEYEELAEKKRNYQQEVEALLKASSKINEYVLLAKG